MKFKNKNLIYLGLTVVVITIILVLFIKKPFVEYFGECENTNSTHDVPENAAEACRKISSKAEEIEAQYNGIANIIANVPFSSLFNPNNYKSGDNTSNDMMRNIINTNLSKCEVENISTSCSNMAGSIQSNVIDTTMCHICTDVDPKLCVIKGNVQINEAKASQTCNMKLAIKSLSEKTTSVDAQALAKVMQKVEGVLSGNNKTLSENCNIISQDLSTTSYLNQKSSCINTLNLTQENILKGCAFIDNVQKNLSEQIQECIIGVDTQKQDKFNATAEIKKEIVTEQATKGIDQTALIASAASSCSSVILAGAILFYIGNQEV